MEMQGEAHGTAHPPAGALCRAVPAAPAAVGQCRINEHTWGIIMLCFVTHGLETITATNQRSFGQMLLCTVTREKWFKI